MSENNTNKDLGLSVPKRPKSVSEEQEKQILKLNHEGQNAWQIAKLTGIPRTSVVRDLEFLAQDPTNEVKDNRNKNLGRSVDRNERLQRNAYLRQVRKQKQSDRRKKVLELNRANKSIYEICKELGLPKSTVFGDLKALSKNPENNITNNKRDKWKTVCRIIRDEYLPYYKSRGIKPTLRTVYYRLIAEGHIIKSESENDRLSKYTVKARLGEEGWPQLPINCFADDTREVISGYENYEPEEPVPPEDPDEYIQNAIQDLKDAPKDYNYEGEEGQVGGHWYNQFEYVAVWEEKAALAQTFKKFIEDRHVDLVVNRGYSSLTFLYENCKDLKPIVDKFGKDHVHILYFGDFDQSGVQIDETIKKYFRIFDIPAPKKIFERVAVTKEQIEEYGIQTRTVYYRKNNGRFEKGENPNTNAFVIKYGDGEIAEAADLDGFMAADDEAFEELVQDAIDQYRDQSIYDEMVKDYEGVLAELPDYEDLEVVRQRMRKKITEAFKEGWDADEE